MSHELPDLDSLPPYALLTRSEVARITGFCTGTLKLWARKGRGPRVTRLERNLPRYRAEDVRKWMGGQHG